MAMLRGERVRPEERRSSLTYTLEIRGDARTKAHVTLGLYPNGKVCEVFVTVAKIGSDQRAAYEAWAMTASKALQHGMPVSVLVKATRYLSDTTAGDLRWPDGRSTRCSSLWDAIAQLLEEVAG